MDKNLETLSKPELTELIRYIKSAVAALDYIADAIMDDFDADDYEYNIGDVIDDDGWIEIYFTREFGRETESAGCFPVKVNELLYPVIAINRHRLSINQGRDHDKI